MELIISVRATVSDEKEIFCHLIDFEVCVCARARGEREKTITDEDIANDESFLI